VSDAPLYRRVLWLSALGVVASLSGIVAALWCQNKPLKVVIILLGAGLAVMCGATIVTPY
jgi:hypothetical protein